ncbi:NmrA family NAD(P)-binding protein [Mycobacterium sp. 852002-51057_SCH5723018]|uniref:NmrA family NAD(P)-binding protein n=1 Tax=Mycobacterium sp. 852002-51057_SCH5723018 TaxID=1834094 RepID=UPI0008004095|nr:NmrA family NAD(P)-binding protein [Mycobacterium sp. 852002-51057_SCH5723018]OBG28731.1 NmrA family transcriptional regulator [Mycobacterium sp. 852002-51057_SCH5723018]
MSTFLVTGPTGVVGHYLTHLLLERGHQVRALAHRADQRSEGLRKAGAHVVVGDLLDLAAMRAATEGVDGAYFSYPIMPGLLEATTIFAQAATEAGVGIIVNMSQKPARPDAGSNASRQHWLSERIFNNFPVPTAHIKPTLFAEWLIQFLDADNMLRLPFADGRHAPIAGEDQAYVVAGILEHRQNHDGKEYPLYGPVEMNHFEIAEELSNTLGVPFTYEPVSIDAFADTMRRQGFHEHTIQHIENIAQDYRDGIFAGTNDVVEKMGDKTPTSVSEFALRNKEYLVDKQRWGYWLSARS